MFLNIFHNITCKIINCNTLNEGRLKYLPNNIILASSFSSINPLFQNFVDIILEALILFHVIPIKFPFRLEFLLLSTISAFLAYTNLQKFRKKQFRFTTEIIRIEFILEVSLVVADLYLLFTQPKLFPV